MALVKRKGPPAVSRHNTRLRKRHIVGRLIDDHGYLLTREQDIYQEGEEKKSSADSTRVAC